MEEPEKKLIYYDAYSKKIKSLFYRFVSFYQNVDYKAFTIIEIIVVIAIIGISISILIPAVQSARETSRRASCSNNMRQIGVGLQNYMSNHNCFPPILLASDRSASASKNTTVYGNCYSAFARLLPVLELNDQYNSINFNFLPDFPAGLVSNQTTMFSNISIFVCPSDPSPSVAGYGRSNYRASIGPRTMMSPAVDIYHPGSDVISGPFRTGSSRQASEFTDGLSNTVGISERIQGDWYNGIISKNGDYPLGDRNYDGLGADIAVSYCRTVKSLPNVVYESRGGESWFLTGMHFSIYNHCSYPNHHEDDCGFSRYNSTVHDRCMIDGVFSASSFHPGGVNVLFMSGDVRFIRNSVNIQTWRALSTCSDGEIFYIDNN